MLTRDKLHPYQLAGYQRIIDNTHTGLFLDMGLGKTVTTLTAINDLIYADLAIRNALIVAPRRVVESVWRQEAKKWEHLHHLSIAPIHGTPSQRKFGMTRNADIYLVSRDNLAWLCGQFGGSRLPFDMLVIDESSSFKNHASQRFKALKLVQADFKRVVILTGTPAPNSLADLWSQIWLLDRGERLGRTITSFREVYLRRAYNGFGYEVPQASVNEIQNRIADIVVSMKAADYLTLPKRITNIIRLEMPPELKHKYRDFEREKVLELISECEGEVKVTAANAAALSNKLLQFSNGAVYTHKPGEPHAYEVIHDMKLDALEEILESAQGNPVLVAWGYRSDAERIMKRFKAYKPRQMSSDKDVAEWNAGKIPLMLMHPASGGHGLNLQEGGHMIVWYGNTWSLELEEQFNARVDRQGQTKTPIIHKLVVEGTVDEMVIEAQERKADGQNALMAAVKLLVNKINKF